jgi:ParG protein
MKKITLRQPEERMATSADEWVSGLATQKPTNTETQKRTGQKLARLTIDLPQELHGRFKAACAQQHTKMKDEVLSFIEKWTREHS